MDKTRRVSVIMGIYNCADTLAEAIDSLLSQTFTDWELIMCDDCSTDNTIKVATSYVTKYNNIHLIKNSTNKGLAASLNHCLKYAKGEYIARMDGDDISLPERFAKEVAFLDENPEYAIVSCSMICFDDNGDWGQQTKPEKPDKLTFVHISPFNHAACMMRKDALNDVGKYTVREDLRRGQDYYLWHKFYVSGYKGYNLQIALYKMRDDLNATKRRSLKMRLKGIKVQYEIFRNLKIPFYHYYIIILKPLIAIIMPKGMQNLIHRLRN